MGVHRYARPNRPWVFRTRPPLPQSLEAALAWSPDGIIAHAYSASMADRLQELPIPVVTVSESLPGLSIPRVGLDNVAIGRLAAEHLLDRGFRSFAYFGDSKVVYSRKRESGFRQRLAEAGCDCPVHDEAQSEGFYDHWSQATESLGRFLNGLPKPVGVFACKDEYALLLSECCLELGIGVPEQVAVVGVGNDELICDRAYPPLSSVRVPTEQLGLDAARLLERLMGGAAAPAHPRNLPPLGVQTRRSTDVLAIADPAVAAAMQFISAHATERIAVTDVLGAVPMCRRAMERRFRQVLGRTMLEEIYRVRLNQAMGLLASTTMALPEVATAAGFRDGYHLWATFRKKTGISPADYRRLHQAS